MGRRADPDRFIVSKDALVPGIFFVLLVRWCVAAYPYSGYKKPPMYGDYEAQRHWQEITVQTPLTNWYRNTTQNDLEYWGLDYPPLTAYHSFMIGTVAEWIDPESVRLFASRGYENDDHKTFMRWTVFLSDVYFYVSPVLCMCIDLERIKPKGVKNVFKRTDIAFILFLLYPGMILVDHGHFQYNCVSLGLFIWAVFFVICIESDVLATVFFVLALNYKQMELYHSLPFFFYLLRRCFIGIPNKGRFSFLIFKFNKIAVSVVSFFIIVWYPFTISWDTVKTVAFRLFPLKRGIFEDKVSNLWCFINVFIKLKTVYSNEEMAKMCMVTTAAAALPSCIDLFFRFNKKKFVLCLINVSLAFYLFSFQVHEKTILLVAVPVAMHFAEDPFMCFFFLLVSSFSLLPLFIKDGLIIPFVVTNIIYMAFYSIALKLAQPNAGMLSFFNANRIYKVVQPEKTQNSVLLGLLSTNCFCSVLCMIGLTLVSVFIKPPDKYPDLFPLLISVYCGSHFLLFFMYFYYQQFSLPAFIENKQKVKNN